jgi:protein O-GlcNAc transferase
VAKKNKKSKRPSWHQKRTKQVSRPPDGFPRSSILQQALVLHQAGRLSEAEALYRQILQAVPNHPEALHYLGLLAHEVGKNGIAVELMGRAVACRPDYVEAHYNMGNVLDDLGNADKAAACYRRALALKPDHVDAHYNLGLLLQTQGKPDEAAACYRQALILKPDYVEAHNNLGIALKDQGRLDEALDSFRRALTLKPDYFEAHSNLLFCLIYLPSQSIPQYLDEARLYGRQVAARVRIRFSDWICASRPERLCIGLVSNDFRNHPVGYFLENMLAHIDTTRLDLVAYPANREEDELTARIRPRFAAWKPLVGMDDEVAAHLIHNDGMHILIDLSGHTSHNRLPVFARKPAPVQVTWLGYFASTGMAEMDYLIADRESVPESCRESFTETVWYLPETRWCFSPPVSDKELAVAPLPALHNGYITFGCFQNLAKLNDEVLAVWGRILQALPLSRLRLQNPQNNSPALREELQRRLARQGIAPERVMFEKPVPRLDYLAAHAHIDIILDTFPFSGATTTCEALWMGVPTVTLAGNTMVARQGVSLLTCAGLTNWIAANVEDYVAKAVAYATDVEKLACLRAGLRQQVLSSPLFDGPRFARNFEAALWNMWNRYKEN